MAVYILLPNNQQSVTTMIQSTQVEEKEKALYSACRCRFPAPRLQFTIIDPCRTICHYKETPFQGNATATTSLQSMPLQLCHGKNATAATPLVP